MNKTTKRILVIIPVCIALLLAAFWAVLAHNAAPVDQLVAKSVEGRAPAFGSGDGALTLTEDTQPAAPNNGRIDTAGKLLYMLNDTNTSNTYYLEADFVITALLWSKVNNYTLERKFTIDGGASQHSITYAPNSDTDTNQLSTSTYGGLFANFSGNLKNMKYIFKGSLEACVYDINSSDSAKPEMNYGGLAGLFSGTIDNCVISMQGTISVYANRHNCTIYVGGIAAKMQGAVISNSELNVAGSVTASSLYETDGNEIKRSTLTNMLYAGGIAAYSKANGSVQTTIRNSTVAVSGAIYTHDNATKASGVGGWFQSKNSSSYIFPAGGIVATADGLVLEYNTIGVTGRINATGGEVSGVDGAIAGGLVGYSTASTYLSVSANVLHLTGTLMGAHERDDANVYKGGFVGRFAGLSASAQGKLAKNAIYYSMKVAKSTVDGTEYYGYMCGNNGGTFKTWNAGSNWMVIQGSDEVSAITDIVKTACTPNADCGTMGTLMVYGGGNVTATIRSNAITFYANQQYSPFYNWLSNIDGATATPYTTDVNTAQALDYNNNPYIQYMFTPTTASAGRTVYAVFLTCNIATAGQLVQWTEEMNSGLNRQWIKAKLVDDVTIENGVNIVNDFYGEFDGNGKTLVFNTGATLNGVANLLVDSNKSLDEAKVVFGVTGDKTKEYSAAGLFRIVRSTATIHDLNYTFAGKIYAGNETSLYATAGALAACNFGVIRDITFNLPQAGVVTATGATAYAGGLVGMDYGHAAGGSNNSISNINAVVEGRVKAAAGGCTTGGLVGAAVMNTIDTLYKNINVDVRGQVNAFINTDSGSARTAGLVGTVASTLRLQTVVLNVRDKSNLDGDVLVATCKHNPIFYQELLQLVRGFNVNANKDTVLDDLNDIYILLFGDPDEADAANHMCSGSTTNVAFETLKANVNEAISRYGDGTNSTLTNAWFKANVLKLAETIDCNAPCYNCKKKCHSAFFVAALGYGKDLSQVWSVGSYAQFAGSSEHPDPGISRIPFFGENEEDVPTAMTYGLNLIYVQDGTASCSMGSELVFFVPIEDSSHVFTGWFVNYGLDTMVDSSKIRDSYFVPGTQAGSVWFSRVINSMITTADELAVLARTTNAGQRYEGITFTLGCDIKVSGDFNPIGVPEDNHYFNGTFDGRGFAIVLNKGFATSYSQAGNAIPYSAIGVFGCLGAKAQVMQLGVKVNVAINNVSGKVLGLVCAINSGKVGQNAVEDIRVYINQQISTAAVAGGVVGVNNASGVVQNAAVYFARSGGKLHTAASTLSYMGGASMAGGAVAYNCGTVRNVQVTMYNNETVNAKSSNGLYKGGIVGYNGAQLYSSLVNIYADSDEDQVVTAGTNSGILVGYNASENIDSLWAVYCLSNDDGFLVPAQQTLLNGEGQGNRMVRYGYGDIETEILGNTASQLMGGSILFSAVEDSVHKVAFYAYTQSFDSAQHEEGGSTFMPAVGSDEGGKTYYCVFANAEITSESDFYNFIAHINSGFRAYVEYTIHLKGGTVVGLNVDDPAYNSIGASNNVFVGAFNANNVPIELATTKAESSTVPLFGTIGPNSVVRNLNLRYFENVNVRKGYAYTVDDQPKWLLGAVAYVNLGTIDNLTMTFESGLYGSAAGFGTQGYADYSGVVVGYNNGIIRNSKIACIAGSYTGKSVAGSVFGVYSGVIAGYNDVNGVIGSDDVASITVNMEAASSGRTTEVVGIAAAGAIVGYNAGTIANANATVQGYVGTPTLVNDTIVMGYTASYSQYCVARPVVATPYVGGIAGYNAGTVYGVRITMDTAASVRAEEGYVGGVVGINAATGTVGTAQGTDRITAVWNTNLTGANRFGGVAGSNHGTMYRASVTINASVITQESVGGIAGHNTSRLDTVDVTVAEEVRLAAEGGHAGGIVGYNQGYVSMPSAVIYGYLGNDNTVAVGGFAGYTSGTFNNGYVVLYHDVTATANGKKGVALGYSAQAIEEGQPVPYGINCWAATFNSVRLGTSYSAASGFNLLKVVGKQMVTAAIAGTANLPRIRFTTAMSGINWYSNIAELSYIVGSDGLNVTGSTYLPLADALDCNYHLCSYDLTVDSEIDLGNLYSSINSADLFYGVTFRLTGNIDVNTKIQPIGTLEHPFTGIFDGNGKTISFRAESGIVGSQYSGLFGYVADCAILKDFVLQIDEGVQISSTTGYVGTLAGCIEGTVQNVAINMRSAPTSRTDNTVVGALAGAVTGKARFENTWISVYNRSISAVVGEDASLPAYRYNLLKVFGRGVLSFGMYKDSNKQYAFGFTVSEGKEFFDNWYADFDAGASGVFSGNAIGTYSGASAETVQYFPVRNLNGKMYTSSFVSLIIHDAEEFYQFAQNINDFGVDGRFTMDLSGLGARVTELHIDLSRMQPIGTNTHPFCATFDGSNPHIEGVYTLILQGTIRQHEDDYSGLFGNVGAGAVIRNIVVMADTDVPQQLGANTSISTGFLAGTLSGTEADPITLESVVVKVNANTTLINGRADAKGSIAGLWGRNIVVKNTWAVLPENIQTGVDYGMIGSYHTDSGMHAYVEGAKVGTVDLPCTMYLCGGNDLTITHLKVGTDPNDADHYLYNIQFGLDSSEEYPFRFIDKNSTTEYSGADKEPEFVTTGSLTDWHDYVYLALYLKTDIESAADLRNLADMVEAGRNYHNVVYTLTNDIVLTAKAVSEGAADPWQWKPIGGSVETAVGSNEYKQVPFVGVLDGNGYKITMPQQLWTDAEYAGLFGILSDRATVRNLYLCCQASIGNSGTSQYAGALAGIDQGATLRNIIVEIQTQATLNAKLSTGRVAVNQALVYDVDGYVTNYNEVNKAYNVWVLCYNSHYTVDQNNAEAAFNNAIPMDTTTPFKGVGSYNGGVNVLTMIANGSVAMSFRTDAAGMLLQENGANRVKEWYYILADGTKQDCADKYGRDGNSDRKLGADVANEIVYASFVKETIDNLSDLIKLGNDVRAGCDLYDITFTLGSDLTISTETLAAAGVAAFAPLGTGNTAFNAIFDGCGHTLYVTSDITITGTYAGIFGVLGKDAVLSNIKLQLACTIGDVDTLYAGAVAYNKGRLDSVIIDATEIGLNGVNAGAAFGYDENNLHTNTWLFVKGRDSFAPVGGIKNIKPDKVLETAAINILKVVGTGTLTTEFVHPAVSCTGHVDGNGDGECDLCGKKMSTSCNIHIDHNADGRCDTCRVQLQRIYYVRMYNNDDDHAVLGWYNDFSDDDPLTTSLNITPAAYPAITAGDRGAFVASNEILSKRYEVVIISTVITDAGDLVKLSADVRGGYTYANTTFTLGADIQLSGKEAMQFQPIGTQDVPFMGTFQGCDSSTGSYYTITMYRQDNNHMDQGVALFGVNYGTVENLLVRVAVDITVDIKDDHGDEIGAIARVNYGTIQNCMVALVPGEDRASDTVTMRGSVVGGIAGVNRGTVRNCVVYIDNKATIKATIAAGGLVGQNEGTIEGSYGGDNSELSVWNNNAAACALRTDNNGATLQWASVLLYGVVRIENNTDEIATFAGGAVGETRSRAEIDRLSVIVMAEGSVQGQGYNLNLGGMAGRSRSAMSNSTVLFEGSLTYQGAQPTVDGVPVAQPKLNSVYRGYFVGATQSSATNSWLIVRVATDSTPAVGSGSSVNVLRINGKGYINSYIDRSDNILFYNTTPEGGASIDGWYLSSNASAEAIGGINKDSFAPNRTVMGYVVTVVFISTVIENVEELLDMANTVNAGLFAKDLHFELQADLDVDVDATGLMATLAIGTKDNPFKHTFDGQGHTITFHRSGTEGAAAYLGLFGYTGIGASISNLNIVFGEGTYGLAGTTQAIGGLVGVNNGSIANCSVTLGAAATQLKPAVTPVFVGVKVGGLVGENAGTVYDCTLATWAVLRADNGLRDFNGSQYAGGVCGANDGTIARLTVSLAGEIAGKHSRYDPGVTVADVYQGIAYVGGVCGINKHALSNVSVLLGEVNITSYSSVLAYAGGVCGNNSGSVFRVYVDVTEDAKLESDSVAGGLVGANNNRLDNILVAYRSTCRAIQNVDAAVGDTGTEGKANAVWVYNYNTALNSRDSMVNNVTTSIATGSGNAVVTFNDPDQNDSAPVVEDGTICFYATINAADGITMYALANDYSAVLLDDFVSYSGSGNAMRLVLDANAFVPDVKRIAVSVKAVIRRQLQHQTELKAIAKCLADANGQEITGTYTITKDIDVDGTYRSIGTENRPFKATLEGGMHEIRFADSTVYDDAGAAAMFEYLTGSVRQVVIRLNAPLSGVHPAGITWQNKGSLSYVVVYAAQGVSLTNPTFAEGTPSSANTQVWVVAREVVNIESGNNIFGSILVAGPGTLSVRLAGNNLLFHADVDDPAPGQDYVNTFAGWSNRLTMFDDDEQTLDFDAQAMVKDHGYRFRADFISTNIATEADMANLIQLLAMNYKGVKKQNNTSDPTVYYLTADIHIDSSDFANYFGDFGGVIDGNFHTLTIDGNEDAVFGAFGSEMRNIIVDATAITVDGNGDAYHLFAAGSKAHLTNAVFYVSGDTGSLQPLGYNTLNYLRVYFVMTEANWYAHHYETMDVADYMNIDHIGLFVTQRGALDFGLDSRSKFVMSIETDVDGYYFAGWTDLVSKAIMPSATVDLTGAEAYRAEYVKERLDTQADLQTLAKFVNAGRTFEDFAFTLGGDIAIASATLTLGKDGAVFAGSLDGQNHTITVSAANNAPLFGNMGGTLSNLVFATRQGGIASVVTGTIHNVVVASAAAQAVYADSITGEVDNAWLVVKGGQLGTVPASVKVVVMQDVVEVLGISVVGGVMHIDFRSSDDDKFMVWRNADGSVKDVGNYNFISSDVDNDDYYYVEATNIIANASEYVYFAKATASKFDGVAYLVNDITLGSTTLQPLNYVFSLDGNGHTITVESSAVLCLVGKGSTGNSSISNLVLDILPTVATFTLCRQTSGSGVCNFNNVVVASQGTAVSWAYCTFVNTWWLHKAPIVETDQLATAYSTLPVGVNVLRYAVGSILPDITITITPDPLNPGQNKREVGLSVREGEYGVEEAQRNLYFLGYYFDSTNHATGSLDLTGTAGDAKRYQAFFATPQVADAEAWTHNAMAMRLSGKTDIDLTLVSDIVAESYFEPIAAFDGTLYGAFHSVILPAGVDAGAVVQTRDGRVQDLAIEVYYGYTHTDVTWLQVTGNGAVANCWIVNDTGASLTHADGVRVMKVQDEPSVDKSQKKGTGIKVEDADNAFVFVADDKNEYRLHYYKMNDVQYEEDAWAVVFENDKTDDIIAIFNSCYTITVEVSGISKALVASKGDAFLTQTTPRWSDAGIYTVQYKDLSQLRQIAGYMFVGFSTTSTSAAIDKRSLTEWDVDTASLDQSVTITANFVQLTSDWSEVRFGDLTGAQMEQYLVLSPHIYDAIATLNATCVDNGWSVAVQVSRSVEIDGDVKGLVDNKPYHAGGYIVTFNVFYMDGLARRYLGVSDGLSFRISARDLHFERIDIDPKKYDGTATAHVTHIELGGFATDATLEAEYKQQVSTAGIVLQYYDAALRTVTANAGTWNLVVADGSYLEAATLNSTLLFDSDYRLPGGVLYLYAAQNENNVMQYVRADDAYSADILKQDLDMLVEDISMQYLDQFGSFDAEGNYKPINIHDYFEGGVRITGFINEQEEADIKEKAAKLLRVAGDVTAVDADGNVAYTYYLRRPGTYFIEVISDALANYEPRISSHKATLTILPSAITVVMAPALDANGAVVDGQSTTAVQYGDTPTDLRYALYYGGTAYLPIQALADALATAPAGAYGNVRAENWFAVSLRPVAAYADGKLVSFNTVDVGVVGMQFVYSAANTSLVLDDAAMQQTDSTVAVQASINGDNTKDYLVTQADVLLVSRRTIVYQVTAGNTKVFGAEDVVPSGHTVGKLLAEGDRLVFSRQSGELVGEYEIYVTVQDANKKDVSRRYELSPYGNRDYRFQITKRTIVVTRTGTGVYYYGSSEIGDMPYALSVSTKIKENILKALDVKGEFDNMVDITVGYFSRVPQEVRDTPYNTVEMEHDYSGNLARKRAEADRCMEFVLDEKSRTYMVVRAPLTVQLGSYDRDYDTTVPDQDTLRSQLPVEVTGWADGDEDILEVRVGSYECSNLSAASGTYFITPTGLVIAYRNGSGTLINNYVVDTVIGGSYTIKGITVSIAVKIGQYNEDGSFVDSNGTRGEDGSITGVRAILFGSADNEWYFDTKIDSLPAYLRTAYYTLYPQDAPATDLQKTQWLQAKLGIVASEIGSLAAGTGITADYKPYSNNPNITLSVQGANYRVNAVRIQLSDIKVTAANAKSRPEVSFSVKAYSVDENGNETDITDSYCTTSKFVKVAEGDRVNINDTLSLVVSYTAYTVNDCMLNLTPYVMDNNTWHVYDQVTNTPVVVYAAQDDEGNDTWVASANILQQVDVNPGLWDTLLAVLSDNLTTTVVSTVACALAIAVLAWLGAFLRRRDRLRRAVQRSLANDAYFRANPQAAQRPVDDFDFDDEVPGGDAADGTSADSGE